jgi:hypothetical protein
MHFENLICKLLVYSSGAFDRRLDSAAQRENRPQSQFVKFLCGGSEFGKYFNNAVL